MKPYISPLDVCANCHHCYAAHTILRCTNRSQTDKEHPEEWEQCECTGFVQVEEREDSMPDITNAVRQLQIRARNHVFVRVLLNAQRENNWDERAAYALLACYQADTIKRMAEEIITLRNQTAGAVPHE